MKWIAKYLIWVVCVGLVSVAIGMGANAVRANQLPKEYKSIGKRLDDDLRLFMRGKWTGELEIHPRHISKISVDQLDKLIDKKRVLLIDARSRWHFSALGSLPDSISLPRKDFAKYYAWQVRDINLALKTNKTVCVFCVNERCPDAAYVGVGLVRLGVPLDRVVIYQNGISEWKELGRDIVKQ